MFNQTTINITFCEIDWNFKHLNSKSENTGKRISLEYDYVTSTKTHNLCHKKPTDTWGLVDILTIEA